MANNVQVEIDIPQSVNYQSCTVQAGTTTTLASDQNATVTNSGTVYNAVLDFGIPSGKSAYEQAVEGGYTGTEQEFNDALASDIATVADNISDINAVSANISDVSAVANNETNINTVAGVSSDITTVAGISSDVTQVASISTAVSTVSGHDSEVTLVADNMASVMTTASSITDVQNVASDITNINTVAGISSDVSTVATNSTAVNTAATNIAAIIAAPTAATNAANSAAEAQIWAEGTDGQVSPLGGEHSSKGWAGIAKQYAESIGAALKYKGSVSTYSALPSTGQEIGDFWNVLDTGKNYAWTGTEWDDISGIMDLSAYRTAAAQDIIDSGKQATLVSGTNIKTVNSTSLLGSGDITIDSLPSQTGQSGKFLTTDGTDASWANVDALPSQTGQNGKFLTTNGTAASWSTIPAGVSADGTTIENVSNVFTTIGVKDQNTATAKKFWTGTKDEYDAIVTKDPNTTYITTDEESDPGGGGGGGGDGADTSLSNLTDAGKIQVATLAAPSDTYDDLVLGASGDTYTMPSDGFLFLWIDFSGAYSGMQVYNTSTHRGESRYSSGTVSNALTLAVHKGEVIAVTYWTASGYSTSYFRFFYAVGSESEKA